LCPYGTTAHFHTDQRESWSLTSKGLHYAGV
jgi:hypothetical protein